jgi:hypothetical protein
MPGESKLRRHPGNQGVCALHVEINEKKGQQPLKRTDYRNRHGQLPRLSRWKVTLVTEPVHEPFDGKVPKQSYGKAEDEQESGHDAI